VQAALASAASFAVGAALPLLVAALAPPRACARVAVASLACSPRSASAAQAGGARVIPAALRVTFWSALAMAVTAAIGALVGTAI
jgi:VIT1/CCC1 family predicted Fe2+/Mn2+ transporter